MLLKKRRSNGLFGLDIGMRQVKLLGIDTNSQPNQVTYFYSAELPAGAATKTEIKDPLLVGTTLRNLIKNAKTDIHSVAIAIPRSSVIIKTIAIDSRLSQSEIESRAWIEANHHFPDLVGEIYLDFYLTPIPQDTKQVELTLVACRKDHISPYLEACNIGGVTAKVIDINSFALERALDIIIKATNDTSTIALLNLDITLSTLLVKENQNLIYAHDYTHDGKRLLAQTGEYIKNAPNHTASINDAAYHEILQGTLSTYLRHTMHFIYSSRSNLTINKILLSGDCALVPCLTEFITQETGIETFIANPFEHLSLAPEYDNDEFKKLAPTLMLSCGLALSSDKPNQSKI